MTQWKIERIAFNRKKVKIYYLGDNHEGHENCDYIAFAELCEKIGRERNSYVILMGDLFEMAVKTKMTREQKINTKHQLKQFLTRIAPIQNKVIAVLAGNHERRIETVEYLQDALMPHLPNAVYLGYEGFINIEMSSPNSLTYPESIDTYHTLIYLHHGNGGSQNPEYFLKKLIFQIGIGGIADVIAVGHIHKQYHNTYILPHAVNGHVKERVVHGIRTGTFLSKADYARISAFGLSKVGGMVMELDTRSRTIERRFSET